MYQKVHPNWTKQNIEDLSLGPEHSGEEVFLQSKCQKCGKELGEHSYSEILVDWVCPVEELTCP